MEKATEEIFGTLHRVSGFTFDTLYDLVFTTERVVVILMQSPEDVEQRDSVWTFIVGNWLSRRQEQKERLKITEERAHQSETMNLDELLAVNHNNYAIRYNDLSSIRIKKSLFDTHLVFESTEPLQKKRLKTAFTLKKLHLLELKQIVSKIPPNLIQSL